MSVVFEYYKVEDDVVAQLQPLALLNIDVVAMPDDDSSYDDTIIQPRVTISFGGSNLLAERSTDIIVYDEELTIDCLIQSKTQRGNNGTHHICKLLKQYLLGFELPNGNRIRYDSYKKADNWRDPENKVWNWWLSLKVTKRQTQEIPENNIIGANLNQITYNDQFL